MENMRWRYLVATTGLGFSDWTLAALDLYLRPTHLRLWPFFPVDCPLKDEHKGR